MRHGKKDNNHRAIAECFQAHGWRVFDMSEKGGGWPDILVAKLKHMALVEVKGEKGKLTPAQKVFLAQNGNTLPIYFATTDADVQAIVADMIGDRLIPRQAC